MLATAVVWALLAVDYATGDPALRGGEDEELQIAQAVVAAVGLVAAVAAILGGIRHARTGDRRARRRHYAALAVVALTLPPWLVLVFILSSD